VKVVYFAWVRERVGKSEEEIELPAEVETVAELVAWLVSKGENYQRAFESAASVRAALDRAHVKPSATIAGAREIAFFPPMTGG
jgi:molybdopterin synthase sulfur carrier subunit